MATLRYEFGPFRLDPVERLLVRDGVEVRLTPTLFELLLLLVRQRGHVLRKDELLSRVWHGRVVEEANLTQSIAMLRKALCDSPHAPRYIETRRRHGYRFVAEVNEAPGAARRLPIRPTVGRELQRAALLVTFEEAVAGPARLVCVTGEPGIGKTTLVENLLTDLHVEGRAVTIARGRCSERLAGTGTYLPWLDALEDLLRVEADGAIVGVMQRVAPTWFAQARPRAGDARLDGPIAEARATSQDLMKRELGVFLQEASRRRPFVIFLDDLHWADVSTIDLLAYLATRFDAMRGVFVVAYRPSELLRTRHPFVAVKQELEARRACRELTLPFLSVAEVEQYLESEFPGHRFPSTLGARIHARTEGNPLFVVDLVRYLRDRGVIVRRAAGAEGAWTLTGPMTALVHELPASVHSLIVRKLAELEPADRLLLTAASVRGHEFDSVVLAMALGRDPAEVEERLDELERVHALVRRVGEEELSASAPTLRYRFVHVLYQDAFAAALTPSRRARLSGAVAHALAGCRGADGGEIASELAHLWEAARDFARATDAYARAAERAAELFAHAEAAALARRGLATLARLPDTPERARQELRLHVTLGVAVSITSGYAAADTGASLTRAYQLCEHLDDAPQLFPALWRLWIASAAGAESTSAVRLARRLVRMARHSQEPTHLVGAHFALGNTLHLLGALRLDSVHLERAVRLYDSRHCQGATTLYTCNPGLYSRSHSARTLWLRGYPDQARQRSHETVAMARAVGDPRSVAHALMFAAICHQLLLEPEAAQDHAEACIDAGEAYGIADEPRRAAIILGWAKAIRGRPAEGIAQIRESLDALRPARSINTLPYYLALLADALGRSGRPAEGLTVVNRALAEIRRTGEPFYEPEVHRLRGELALQSGAREARRNADAAIRRALMLAGRQGAKVLELRAALSLARLCQGVGSEREARTLLARAYRRFTEGFETADLQAARALLRRCSLGDVTLV